MRLARSSPDLASLGCNGFSNKWALKKPASGRRAGQRREKASEGAIPGAVPGAVPGGVLDSARPCGQLRSINYTSEFDLPRGEGAGLFFSHSSWSCLWAARLGENIFSSCWGGCGVSEQPPKGCRCGLLAESTRMLVERGVGVTNMTQNKQGGHSTQSVS